MTSEDPQTRGSEERGRVIRFEPRGRPNRPALRLVRSEPDADPAPPADDLQKYAQSPEEDDYRHRMAINVAGLAFVVALILCGVWLADTIAQMRKNQDCVLMGRRNCAEVNVAPAPR